jgi:hypothetical protein
MKMRMRDHLSSTYPYPSQPPLRKSPWGEGGELGGPLFCTTLKASAPATCVAARQTTGNARPSSAAIDAGVDEIDS